ncbi:MAG: HvfC family RiPP maturation protein [Arenimonas sp.]
MHAPEVLRAQQFAFAAHLRDPDAHAPPPGIEDRRMAIYRDLVFANVEGLLAGGFPVIRATLANADWRALVRAFLRDHRATSPLFPDLPREFVRFVQLRRDAGANDPPWLAELAHYEWIEVALDYAEAEPLMPAPTDFDPLIQPLQASPLAWPLTYAWPVHLIGPDHVPDAPPAEPTCLLVQRDGIGRVHFHAIGVVAFHLLERIAAQPGATGAMHLGALAQHAGADETQFRAQVEPLLRQLVAANVIGPVTD